MKAVKRSIAICVLTLIMCVSLLVGVTFAWFTDSITNSGNVIQAGNVDITWEYKTLGSDEAYAPVTAETPLFDEGTVWEPGLSKGYDFKVTNSGSLAADFKLTFENVMSAGMADITEVLVVSVDSNVKGTVKELSAKDAFIIESRIEAGAEKEFSVEIKMLSSESQDVYQNAMVSFDLGLYAKQTNEDAVYDDNYTDPSFDAVDTVNKLIAAAPEGGVVTLPEDLELNDTLTVSQRALTINFNGAKLIGGDSSPALLVNSTASDLVIENAVIESSSETGKHGLVISAGATGVEVRNCQFTGSGNSSIFVSGSSAADPVIIEDNTFTRPINVEGQDGVIIRNNTFNVTVWSNGITMAGTMGTIEVTGNTVIGAPLVRLYNGMTVKEGSTITVTGNTFENGATAFMAAVEGATESPWSYIEAGTIVTDVFEVSDSAEIVKVLEKAPEGNEIKVAKGISFDQPITIDKKITIDFNGASLTQNLVVNATDVVINNLHIAYDTEGVNGKTPVTSSGNLTLNDCIIERVNLDEQAYGLLVNVQNNILTATNTTFIAPCGEKNENNQSIFARSPSTIEATGGLFLTDCEILTNGYGLFSGHFVSGKVEGTTFKGLEIDGEYKPILIPVNSTVMNGMEFDNCYFEMGEDCFVTAGSFSITNSQFVFTEYTNTLTTIQIYSNSGNIVLKGNEFTFCNESQRGIQFTSNDDWAKGDHDFSVVTVEGNTFNGEGTTYAIKVSSAWINVDTESLKNNNTINNYIIEKLS